MMVIEIQRPQLKILLFHHGRILKKLVMDSMRDIVRGMLLLSVQISSRISMKQHNPEISEGMLVSGVPMLKKHDLE